MFSLSKCSQPSAFLEESFLIQYISVANESPPSHPMREQLEGALEERNNGPVTSVVSAHASSVTLVGGYSSVGCATITYLPGPTTTIVASPVTITTHTTGSPHTVTSYISHSATVVIGSSHIPVTTVPVATQYTTIGTANAIQTTIIATVTAGNGPAHSCVCEPTVTASRTTFFPTETVYPSGAASTSFSTQASTVTAA